ncbi:Tectonin beta-propeller [Desmophyllum pertusum]|uniref:Tectonin beta-propeller n=1 Tax=Desmophyllum pertusum TaxID=174260 RepID=A0A9W9Z342_9CNID|nr:Tectonin beta-propeller [Desmophyllum pertusum]
MVLQEVSPIIQLSYSWQALLISSEKRTVLWDFHNAKATQVGQKERKSPGRYGAMFYPQQEETSGDKLDRSPDVYTSDQAYGYGLQILMGRSPLH